MLHLLALTDSYRVPGFSFVSQQQQLVKESSARYVSTREIHFLLIFLIFYWTQVVQKVAYLFRNQPFLPFMQRENR